MFSCLTSKAKGGLSREEAYVKFLLDKGGVDREGALIERGLNLGRRQPQYSGMDNEGVELLKGSRRETGGRQYESSRLLLITKFGMF